MFDPDDESDARSDDAAEEKFVGSDGTAVDDGFGESGKKRHRGKPDEGDGNVGEFDGREEADPVETDDESNPDGFGDV